MKQGEDDGMIKVGLRWAIKTDRVCSTVYERRITKKGTAVWDYPKHHNDFEQSCRWIIGKEPGLHRDLERIAQSIADLRAWLQESIDALPGGVCLKCGAEYEKDDL